MVSKLKLLAAALSVSAAAFSQTAADTVYVFKDDQPDFLLAPPDTSTIEYVDDFLQWEWGKSQRNTPRGVKASYESRWTQDAARHIMAEALGLDTISYETTPAMAHLLRKAFNTGDQSTAKAKAHFGRTRPFVQMGEDTWGQWDDDYLRTNGSFPSGHTAFGWATALVFAEMWPELQDTILRRGFEFGENRIITGAHYQSDVTAGFLCAAAAIARAHTNPELEKDIKAARAEYALLRGLPADYDPVTGGDVPHGEKFLNNPVDTASYRYYGDLTRYWSTKPLRYTPRGARAADEAVYATETIADIFGQCTGVTVSQQATPAIWALIDTVLVMNSNTVDRLKVIRFRKRPFVQLNEPSFVAGDEEKERGKSSFPSGHTGLGWTEALVLAEVAPEYQDTILRRGYEYGENRLIVGYHWFSDIEATRQLASACVAYLHAGDGFRDMIRQAREEFLKATTPVESTRRGAMPADGRSYSLSGMPATDTTSGVVISDGRKTVR